MSVGRKVLTRPAVLQTRLQGRARINFIADLERGIISDQQASQRRRKSISCDEDVSR